MRTIVYILVILLFPALLPLSAQETVRLPRVVIMEPSFNFGEVSQGEKVEHSFKIENKGNADLQISKVIAACGCTAAILDGDIVKPGESTALKVAFDTAGFSGDKVKTVRLFTNDPKETVALVSLKGFIEPDILIEPKRILFGEVIPATNKFPTQDVKVRVREGKRISLGKPQAVGSGIQVKELSRTDEEVHFQVSVEPDVIPGELRRRVVVSLTGAQRRAVNIPVFASVQGALRLTPPTLGFGVLEGTEPVIRRVRIESLTGDEFSVLSASSRHQAVTVRVLKNEAALQNSIEITVDPKKVQRDLRTSITLKTSHPNQAELLLSVYGILPPSL